MTQQHRCLSGWLVALLLGVLSACGGGSANDGGDDGRNESSALLSFATDGRVLLDAASSCGLSDFQNSLLAEINAARAQARQCGNQSMPAVGPLTWNSRLFSAAAKHSADMATHDYFSHTSRDGRSPSQRISAEGYRWSMAGENIAAGQTSVSSVMAGWLASPDHCINLMLNGYRDVGVACVVAPTGATYSRYWTMKLGSPS